VAVLCVVTLTSCGRYGGDNPPRRSAPLPSLTDSSERHEQKKAKDLACELLTADERQGLSGQTMNVVVPVNAAAGTQECQWAHSLKGTSRSTIRLVVFKTEDWAKVAQAQVTGAMRSRRANAAVVKQLGAAAKKLARGPSKLSDDEVCDIYWTVVSAYGWPRGSDTFFFWMIGQMPAIFSADCSDGVYMLLGYGEYGMQQSTPLYHLLTDLRKTAHDRAVKLIAEDESDDASASPTASPTSSATASPTPSPTTDSGADQSE